MLTERQESDLHRLVEVFLAENSKLNLSAFRTPEQCWMGNVRDSVSLLDILADLKLPAAPRMIDIGTGGGFPLLPLAVCLPDMTCVGLDSTQKKVDAVKRIAGTLGMRNVDLICGRTEELGHNPAHREHYHLVVSRGVAPINTLLEYCSPFCAPGGCVVLWKSLNIEEELNNSLLARAEFSCHLIHQHRYSLDADWGERQLMVFEKGGKLPGKYPRGVGVPKKEPLL